MSGTDVLFLLGSLCLLGGGFLLLLSFIQQMLKRVNRGKELNEMNRMFARNDMNRAIIFASSESPVLRKMYEMLNDDGNLIADSIKLYRSYGR